MYTRLVTLSNLYKKSILMLIDSFLVIFSLFLAFSIRLGFDFEINRSLLLLFLISPVIAVLIFYYHQLYRSIIRYLELDSLFVISKAVSLYSLLWIGIGYMLGAEIPRSVILINWLLLIFLVTGSRIVSKSLLIDSSKKDKNVKNILIYGAGNAGAQLSYALKYSQNYQVLGFVDDDETLQKRLLNNLEIFGSSNLHAIVEKYSISEILIAIPSISNSSKSRIITFLDTLNVKVRMLPDFSELTGGKIKLDDLRDIEIQDLLGRDQVEADKKLLLKNIKNKTVLITGAGGSIGSEISRQVASLDPKKIILYDNSELNLYRIEKELLNANVEIYPILGDILNETKFESVLKKFSVNTIYHTAAYKHVPIIEKNHFEGVKNNIFGTLNVANSAIESNVEIVVFISTDKAVRPTNIMGATKRVAELVLKSLSRKQKSTKFSIVRFGNVLDSSGSVIPHFKELIRERKPLTVTHKDIIRYFMTIPEAVELVIQAGALSIGGEVFLLDMGSPVKIDDLARKMIKLSGLKLRDKLNPEGDIEIIYTGLRPGEKLYEELLIGENPQKTSHPMIMTEKEETLTWSQMEKNLDDLKESMDSMDFDRLKNIFGKIVEGYTPSNEIHDLVSK